MLGAGLDKGLDDGLEATMAGPVQCREPALRDELHARLLADQVLHDIELCAHI